MNVYSSPLNFKKETVLNSDDYASMGTDTDKVAVHMGDGWCTFPDLDNFDSEKLLKALTLKEKDSADSIWDPSLTYQESCQRKGLSVSALRQLEALFNLSQLLFGLSRAETVNYTFRDLQLRKYPHSFKKAGFKQLNAEGRIDFYAIFEQLVQSIIDEGGLEVTLLMYKNPQLAMVRQKCLDLISNVATVPDVAYKIMRHQSWFLDHLLIMLRDGDIVSDKIPALSVLIRLLKVMLTERMISSYMKLVDMQYIDCLVDIFENPKFTHTTDILPFFIKFEFITMQSLTVILGDAEYSQFWSDKAKTRLLNYCMIVLLKAAGAFPVLSSHSGDGSNECIENINHIYYAEQHTNKHSLAHTIMTVTELLRNDDNMKMFYRYHRPFKQLIVQLYKKYGAKSQFIRIDPGISYALNHLMRALYIKSTSNQMPSVQSAPQQLVPGSSRMFENETKAEIININASPALGQGLTRKCSNIECQNEETKYKPFKECSRCAGKAAYCSSKCKKTHIGFHRKHECIGQNNKIKINDKNSEYQNIYENVISSSSSTTNQQQQQQRAHQKRYSKIHEGSGGVLINGAINVQEKNSSNNVGAMRRASENLHQKKNYRALITQDMKYTYKPESAEKKSETKENQGGISRGAYETYSQNGKMKRLYKYSSMNENHRRTSLASPLQTKINSATKQQRKAKLQHEQLLQLQLQQNPPTKAYYSKHTNSMKEIKSNYLNSANMRRASCLGDDANLRTKLMVNDNAALINHQYRENETNSIHFVRPLKTSTAVCLTDLTRKNSLHEPILIQATGRQHSSDTSSNASSTVSSESSTNIQIPKKFKTLNGLAIKTSKEIPMSKYEERHQSPDSSSIAATCEDTLLSNEISMPTHKRRHSITSAAIYQSTTTQKITTTTTKTKTKLCEADSTSSTISKYNPFTGRLSDDNLQKLAAFSNDSQDYFYHGKEPSNGNSAYNRNLLKDFYRFQKKNDLMPNEEDEDVDEDDENNFISESDSSLDSGNNDTIEKGKEKFEQEEDDDDDDDDEEDDDEDDGDSEDEDNDENNEELEEVEEIEGERRWINDQHENMGIQFVMKKDIIEYVNEDEQDRRSHFKVVKEFEKTLEFVKNASSLKVMNTQQIHSSSSSNSSSSTANGLPILDGNDTNFSSLKAPQISFASLCYDQQSSLTNKKNLDSDDTSSSISSHRSQETSTVETNDKNEIDTRRTNEEPLKYSNYIINKGSKPSKDLKPIIKQKSSSSQLKGVNLIINNSIDSHMLTNSFDLKSTAAIKSDANPSKKLQKLKQKEVNEGRKSQYNNVYSGTDNDQKIYVNEEEMSLFKNKPSTSKTFQLPTIVINGCSNHTQGNYENVCYGADSNQDIPLSLQPIVINQQESSSPSPPLYGSVRLSKKSGKFNELKVFAAEQIATEQKSTLSNQIDTTILNSNEKNAEFKLITNSTPLFNDTNNAAELFRGRKQFLNAQLNLTIAPPPTTSNPIFLVPKVPITETASLVNNQDQTINNAPKPPPFSSTPMINYQQQQQQIESEGNKFFKLASIKSNKSKQNLIASENIKEEECEQQLNLQQFNRDQHMPSIGGTQVTGSLNLSRISAITSETNLVTVVKTEIPKDIKKCLKEELKKDKKNCVIQ